MGYVAAPALDDFDFDGDLDLLLGFSDGNLLSFSSAPRNQVNVTAEPDPADISISDITIFEGNTDTRVVTFTVTRSNNSGSFTLDYSTANGSTNPATSGIDYVADAGTLSFFEDGDLSQTVSITIYGDTTFEAMKPSSSTSSMSVIPASPRLSTRRGLGLSSKMITPPLASRVSPPRSTSLKMPSARRHSCSMRM